MAVGLAVTPRRLCRGGGLSPPGETYQGTGRTTPFRIARPVDEYKGLVHCEAGQILVIVPGMAVLGFFALSSRLRLLRRDWLPWRDYMIPEARQAFFVIQRSSRSGETVSYADMVRYIAKRTGDPRFARAWHDGGMSPRRS